MRHLCFLIILMSHSWQALSQDYVVTTAVPFLLISPDARSAAMGNAGLAMSADGNAVFWNTGKIVFSEKPFAISVTHNPWLHSDLSDINLETIGGFIQLDENQALAFGMRYFDLGTITFTGHAGTQLGEFKPREYSIQAGYSRKLTDYLSLGLNLGFINSSLATGFSVDNIPIKSGVAACADVALFLSHPAKFGKLRGDYNIAVTAANIGNKISYTETAEEKDFLPAKLSLGGGIRLQLDEYNEISFNADLNKLMMPQDYDTTDIDEQKSVPEGVFSSFIDSPNGLSGELREVGISSGLEYSYRKILMMRAGYSYSDLSYGIQSVSAGIGINYHLFGFGLSYTVPTNSAATASTNVIRFTLSISAPEGKRSGKGSSIL